MVTLDKFRPENLVSIQAARIHLNQSLAMDEEGDGFTESQGDCNDQGDCDDLDDSVFPGATEICGDGVDQDCDGYDTECVNNICEETALDHRVSGCISTRMEEIILSPLRMTCLFKLWKLTHISQVHLAVHYILNLDVQVFR